MIELRETSVGIFLVNGLKVYVWNVKEKKFIRCEFKDIKNE